MSSMSDSSPVLDPSAPFDPRSGSLVERVLFNGRFWVLLICAVVTVLMALQLPKLRTNGSFERMIPTAHPFIANYLAMKGDLPNPNVVRVVVARAEGDIYNAAFLDQVRQMTNEFISLPGVDRVGLKSLWTPNTRWQGIT
jgi:predicted RND superfamily exporter protein